MSQSLAHTDSTEYNLLVSRGLIPGVASVIQIGRAPMGVQTTISDIWNRCDATPTQQIWTQPTVTRVHNIVSTSASDAPAGVGALAVLVTGLTSWSTAESSEVVVLNGVVSVATVNSYVIIHRMAAIAQATTTNVGINAGIITATAVIDVTITAQIDASQAITQMAIYGIPSTKTFYVDNFAAYLNDSAAAARVDVQFRINFNPDVQRFGYANGATLLVQNQGSSAIILDLSLTQPIPGPAIIKIQGIGSAADLDLTAGFAGYLIDN